MARGSHCENVIIATYAQGGHVRKWHGTGLCELLTTGTKKYIGARRCVTRKARND
jgi:hypothetical protein